MEKDYQVYQVEAGWEVCAPLIEHHPIGRALIQTQALKETSGLRFTLVDNKPCVIFRVPSPVAIHIYPEIDKAQRLFASAIAQGEKFQRTLQAIRLVEEGSK